LWESVETIERKTQTQVRSYNIICFNRVLYIKWERLSILYYYYFQFRTIPICTKLANRPSLFRNLSESSDSSLGRVPRAGPVWLRNRPSFRFIRAITLKLARKTNRTALSGDPSARVHIYNIWKSRSVLRPTNPIHADIPRGRPEMQTRATYILMRIYFVDVCVCVCVYGLINSNWNGGVVRL